MAVDEASRWVLTDRNGKHYKLSQSMTFLGREECDIPLSSRTVDKRHAVITFDQYSNSFKIKDLSSINGTFVNDGKVPEQNYVTLKDRDNLRFGYDTMVYRMERLEPTTNSNIEKPLSEQKKPAAKSMDRLPGWVGGEPSSVHGDSYGTRIHLAECQGCMDEQHIKHTCTCDTRDQGSLRNKYLSEQGLNCWQSEQTSPKNDLDPVNGGQIPRSGSYSGRMLHDSDQKNRDSFSSHLEIKLQGSRPKNLDMYTRGAQFHSSSGYTIPVSAADTFVARRSSSSDKFSPDSLSPSKLSKVSSPLTPSESRSKVTASCDQMSRPDHRRTITEGDLETVKRGSSLYGQPTWWGTEEGDNNENAYEQDDNVTRSEVTNMDKEKQEQSTEQTKYSIQPRFEHTYMEISAPRHGHLDKLDTEMTGDKTKDSESLKSTPDKKDSGLAFTVDLDDNDVLDETRSPKISMSDSLSKFLPHKVRRSLREKKGTSSRKKTEESQVDPGSVSPQRQKKLDELWSTVENTSKRRSGYTIAGPGYTSEGPGYTSEGPIYSDADEDLSVRSDSNTKRGSRGTNGTSKQTEKSKQSKLFHEKPKVQHMDSRQDSINFDLDLQRSHDPNIDLIPRSQNPTAYLIERMFEESEPSKKDDSIAVTPTEYYMYTEAKSYDKTKKLSPIPSKRKPNPSIRIPKPNRSQKEPTKSVCKSQNFDKGEDDNVSESGTYTIEAEKSGEEEVIARESIDKVFGLEKDKVGQNDLAEKRNEEGEEVVVRSDNVEDSFTELEVNRAHPNLVVDSLDVEIGSAVNVTTKQMAPQNVAGDKSSWASKWASHTNRQEAVDGQREKFPKNIEPESPNAARRASLEESPRRLKPGRGRKLPPTPGGKSTGASPRESWSDESPRLCPNLNQVKDGKSHSSAVSDVLSKDEDTPRRRATKQGPWRESSKKSVSYSLDTNVLLEDTENVMVAIKSAKNHKSGGLTESRQNGHVINGSGLDVDQSDSDDNIAVIINGTNELHVSEDETDEDHDEDVRPLTSQSYATEASLGALIAKKSMENEKVSSTQRYRKDAYSSDKYYEDRKFPKNQRSYQQQQSIPDVKMQERLGQTVRKTLESFERRNLVESKRNDGQTRDMVSDIMSEPDYESRGLVSPKTDSQSDVSEGSPTSARRAVKEKAGMITNTRPNRAFALRRARAESDTECSTARSESTHVRSILSRNKPVSSSPKRERSRPLSGRSEVTDVQSSVSLGAKIAKKGHENSKMADKFSRSDGGRFSMRVTSTRPPVSSTGTPVKSETKSPRRKLSSSKSSNSLQGGAVSQPGSRSNSPAGVSAEMKAWQRRKTYDPRRAVETAKTKAKESRNNTRMIRSASFNSASDLDFRSGKESESDMSVTSSLDTSVDNYNDDVLMEEANYEASETNSELKIAKISSELAKDLEILSRDEDFSGTYMKPERETILELNGMDSYRSQDSDLELNGSMVSTHTNTSRSSAFTVPTKSPSPLRSPPPPLSAHKRARDIVTDSGNRRKEWEKSESYDSLILSSIYQLSQKLKHTTDKTLAKLREHQHISRTPSPLDDLLAEGIHEIPHWKSANQELAGILRNLRKVEHHLQVMDKTIFPRQEHSPPGGSTSLSESEHQQYLREIHRIQTEIASFQPIQKPSEDLGQKSKGYW